MAVLSIVQHPKGPRVWIANQRIHHGAVGTITLLALLGMKRYRVAWLGLVLMLHDRKDVRIWFKRERHSS